MNAADIAVSCAVCDHEVPLSEVVVAEATDYVVYLCGLDCYQRWRERGDDASYPDER
jgi:hypothetical protein